ncbi:hypothetical protein MHU86_22009 [Fragilaria crotonensis]|nr:hypothetical protein MHU86_22009 [Fragilaria crotonensis]
MRRPGSPPHSAQDVEDELHAENGGDLWALTGAGSTASTVVIENSGAYDGQSGEMIEWTELEGWTSVDDVTTARSKDAPGQTGPAKADGTSKTKKQTGKRSTTGSRTRTTKTPTSKMQEYKKMLMVDSSDEEEDFAGQEQGPTNDENDDPSITVLHSRITVPNILPVPAFIFAAIMEAYTTDAAKLCLAAILAINARARLAGENPRQSQTARRAAYVARWLWNVATSSTKERLGHTAGIVTGQVLNPRADVWSRDTHLRHLATRATVARTAGESSAGEPTSNEAWTNLANALALQVAERSNVAPSVAKKGGFEAFPVTTQQMILFATQRTESGEAATGPVDTYTEILELANAAYVAQHLHHHLKTRLGLDVWLPSGFCSAVRTASFISTSVDRPEAFSLFACGPQPLTKKSSAGMDDGNDNADELMRMQLKITDSTTGLTDKDVKRLTQVRHTVPRDFRELAGLLENMAGVSELVFGTRSPITTMLTAWVHFLTKTGGTTVAHLRQLASVDGTAPSRLGWFIERRLQQFLVACAACDHIDLVDPGLFDFAQARQQLVDGMFQFPISPYLKSKLGGEDSHAVGASSSRGGSSGRSAGYADDVAINPNGRLVKISSKDNWQTFVDHASEAPIPNLCCRYHLNGKCVKSCFHANTHVALTEEQKAGLTTWVAKCRSRMRSNQDEQGEKPKKLKLVNRDHAYSKPATSTSHLDLETRTSRARPRDPHAQPRSQSSPTSPRTAVVPPTSRLPPHAARTASSPAAKSPAAIMHAARLERLAGLASTDGHHHAARTERHASSASPDGYRPSTDDQFQGLPTGSPTSLVDAPLPRPGKCLAPLVPFPNLLRPLDDAYPLLPLPHLPALLASVLSQAAPATHPTDFMFEWTHVAAAHNLATLRRFNFDWGTALAAQPFSTLTPGSEFRPAETLAPLLSRHPLWRRFRERITAGAEFPLLPIDDVDRRTDVIAALARGNHKSARGHEAKLLDMLKDEVRRGWQLPLPKEAALDLPNCEHSGSEEERERPSRGVAINAGQIRTSNDETASFRVLFEATAPTRKAATTKVDCKSAYRRIHLQPTTAAKSCTCIAGILLMALRMTFGGSPNPSQWSDVSEVIADLANDLVRRNDWDENVWQAPQQHMLASDKAIDNDRGFVGSNDAFEPAVAMSSTFPCETTLIFDCYLDDLFELVEKVPKRD